jgi:glucose uptake protein
MILPASSSIALAILVISMICWGTWANTQKLARPRRFELYYFDFLAGFLLIAIVAAFTLGSFNSNELTFQDNFLITGYRNMVWAAGAGMVFSIGGIFLAGTVAVAGLSVAFPVALGTAAVVETAWNLTTGVRVGTMLSLGGILFLVLAMVIVTYAYASHLDRVLSAVKQPVFRPDPRLVKPPRPTSPANAAQAVVLGVISGFAFGFVRPLVDNARANENGLAPYGLAVLFAGGMAVMAIVMAPFFFNFPVSGEPLGLRDLFSGSGGQHLLGIVGGVLAGLAILGGFVVAAAPATAAVGRGLIFGLTQAGTLLAALWGLVAWREFGTASMRIKTLFGVVVILFAIGVAMLSIAQA